MSYFVLGMRRIASEIEGTLYKRWRMNSSAIFFVELEGVEPSSKRGSHMLSTCLSLPSVFECRQDQSHQPAP